VLSRLTLAISCRSFQLGPIRMAYSVSGTTWTTISAELGQNPQISSSRHRPPLTGSWQPKAKVAVPN
jgi:hypothetical protein